MPSLNRLLSDNLPVDPSRNVFTGNGTQTVFNLSGQIAAGSTNPSNLAVSLDGAIQEPVDDYSINNSTLTFTTAPDSGARVVVISRNSPFTYATNLPGDGTVTSAKIVAGNVSPDKLSTGAPFWNSSGNVALGHSSPATNFHLNYSNYAAILMGANNSTGFSITKETPSNTFNIWTGAMGSGTNRLCMTSSGDIGIGGIISPQNKLDVNGVIGFGLRSGGQNQPGYLSNIWSPTVGYRFFTLGSTYCDSNNNWITNPNASFGSNNVCTIVGDTGGGFRVYTSPSTGNTQRTDTNATFESYERFRIGLDGTIDVRNNPIVNCTNVASAWVRYQCQTPITPTAQPNTSSLVPYINQNRVDYRTALNTWWDYHIGMVLYINVFNTLAPLGGVAAVSRPNGFQGVRIRIVEIIQNSPTSIARCEFLDGIASNNTIITGTGTTAGFTSIASPIYESYNVSSITRHGVGENSINFITPMPNRNYAVIGVGGMATDTWQTCVCPDMTNNATAATPNVAYYSRGTTQSARFTLRRTGANTVADPYSVNVAVFAASGQDNV